MLVVEDELWIRRALVEMVDRIDGFKVTGEAENGVEAWELTQELWPNVLITDIMLPHKDGLSLIRDISEHQLPIVSIIVSGYDNFHYAQTAIRFGASEYLLKPVAEHELRDTLNRSLQRLEYNREMHEHLLQIQRFLDDMPRMDPTVVLQACHCLIDSIVRLPNLAARAGLLRVFAGKLGELLAGMNSRHKTEPLREKSDIDEIHAYFRRLAEIWLMEYPAFTNSSSKFAIKRVCDYVKKHYTEDIRISDMASLTNLSGSYLSALFKQHTGLSFVHYVNHVKIEEAKQLLLDPHKKIYEVADSLGFTTIPYFNRLFKNETGMSPNEFRKGMGL